MYEYSNSLIRVLVSRRKYICKTNALTSLCACADWPGPSRFAYDIKAVLTHLALNFLFSISFTWWCRRCFVPVEPNKDKPYILFICAALWAVGYSAYASILACELVLRSYCFIFNFLRETHTLSCDAQTGFCPLL